MPRSRPYIFVGSSGEGLDVAKAVQAELDRTAECHLWSQGLFGESRVPLETLVRIAPDFDFAIIVLTPDDLTTSKGVTQQCPRDNLLFELGLFIGTLGRDRTLIIADRSAAMKLPSDLAGIVPNTYQPPESGTIRAAVGVACSELETVVKRLGPINPELPVEAKFSAGLAAIQGVNTGSIKLGFNYAAVSITNVGQKPIPPYTLRLSLPEDGSLSLFEEHTGVELLEAQTQEHKCFFGVPPVQHLLQAKLGELKAGQQVRFQMVLQKSTKVLLEDAEFGTQLAEILKMLAAGQDITKVRWPYRKARSSS